MIAWAKEHPYLAGTLALVLVVMIVIFRRSGSSSSGSSTVSAGPSESLQAAGLAAGVQLQQAQIAANYGMQQLSSQNLSLATLSAADVTKAQLNQVVQLAQIGAGQEVADFQTSAQLQLGLSALGPVQPIATNPTPSVPNGPSIVVTPSQNSPSFSPAPNFGGGSGGSGTGSGVYDPSRPLEQCGNLGSVGDQYACSLRNLANPNFGINPNAGVTSPGVVADYQRLFGPSGQSPAFGMPLDFNPFPNSTPPLTLPITGGLPPVGGPVTLQTVPPAQTFADFITGRGSQLKGPNGGAVNWGYVAPPTLTQEPGGRGSSNNKGPTGSVINWQNTVDPNAGLY